jgi:hypothetical protein
MACGDLPEGEVALDRPRSFGAWRSRGWSHEERLRAMERYARENACRRRALVGYFGERLAECAGCDRSRAEPASRPLPRAVAERLTRLRQALGGKSGPWGGCLLEPEVLLRLARNPPPDAGALADVPGVGPAVAHGYGPRPSSPKTSSCSSRRSRWCPRARR